MFAPKRASAKANEEDSATDLAEAFEALKAEVRAALEAGADGDLEARIKALESRPQASSASVLTSVKGIGPKYAKALSASGVKTPEDVAAWSDEDILRIAEAVGVPEKKVRAWRTAAAAD